jgi:dihydroceramide fatty acyl 2-hydroxylase
MLFSPPMSALVALLLFALGFLGWSLVEYGIHGFLSHRLKTFVSPMHWGHHRTPAAVFTSPIAWVPIAALLFGLGAWITTTSIAAATTAGLLTGFARYEWLHWRIHFRTPRNAGERRLREHHLAHHFVNPRVYHGVTTRFWDRVFGTLPATAARDYARVADRPAIDGPSNFRLVWSPRASAQIVAANMRRGAKG